MVKYFFLIGVLSITLFACRDRGKDASAGDTSPETAQYEKNQRNKAIALECIRAYAARDSALILSHNAKNVVNIYAGRPPIHGIDSCKIILRESFNTIKEYRPSNELALAENNYVFVFLYVDILFWNNPATYHSKAIEIYKFNDGGKIVEHTAINEELGPNVTKRPL